MRTTVTRRLGGLAAVALGSTLALGGCGGMMDGGGAAMKSDPMKPVDSMTKGDPAMPARTDTMMDKGTMEKK